MILQNDKFTHSPVAQDFIWVAEYPDGTHLSEFDFNTKEENSFYKIDKKRLFRFGLIGHGQKIYFERDGVFNIAGRRILFFYEIDGKMLPLNGDFRYNVNDIITYKDAESSGLVAGFKGQGLLSNRITQYNIGYKTNIQVEGINFHNRFKVKVNPLYLYVGLVANVVLSNRITQYNIGYKTNIQVEGINFHFKPIVKIPFNQPVYFNIWLVADQELNGKFIIVVNGRMRFEINAPLKPNVGGELNWVLQ